MIRSIKDRILVRIVEIKKEKTLLIMPDEKKDFQIGHVVDVGVGITFEDVAIGEYVYTRKYAGLLIEYKGEEFVSRQIKEILAVSEELG